MTERIPTLRMPMLPRDTNAHGTIFGGAILGLIDLAGYSAAREYARKDFATKAMKEVEFIAPVYVGDLVSFFAEVVRVGRTSITIRVEVEAERFTDPGVVVRVTAAEVVYVAIGEAGEVIPIV